MKHKAVALAIASGLSFTPMWADAAGLGKITVYSALGQPLRAEIQIAATRDELAGMTARLAPDEAFKQANVDHYAQPLSQLRFAVEKRAGGAVVKVSSSKPINDPFLDFLVELNWSSGRLVREYTFLLDPPEVIAAQSAAAQPLPVTRGISPTAERVLAERRAGGAGASASPAAAQPQGAAGEHVVKTGETLHGIASANLPAGVSLDQMLVAIYRNNSGAFIGKNVNRLRSGAVLQIPSAAEAAAIPETEARKELRVQVSEWNNYRRKLAESAGSASGESGGSRSSAGKVNVVGGTTPTQSTDQVKVSTSAQSGISQEDWIAKEKELEEYRARVAELEKNVTRLQDLVKAKEGTATQAPAGAATPGPSSTPRESRGGSASGGSPKTGKTDETEPALVPPPVEETPAVQPTVPEATGGSAPVGAVETDTPEGGGPAVEGPPAPPEVEPTQTTPPAEVKPPPVAPEEAPPVEEASDSSLGILIGGAAAVLVAVLGVVLFSRRRKPSDGGKGGDTQKEISTQGLGNLKDSKAQDSTETLGSNSVFQTSQTSGGQSVDTAPTVPPVSSFSVDGPGTFDMGEVDPINEADLYLAYNKDAQAEEILLDALQKDPERIAISVKLLEVYAFRKSLGQFEALASELRTRTGGQGEEWEKVVVLGRELDPNNPLYGGVGKTDVPSSDFVETPAADAFDDAADEQSFEFAAKTEIEPRTLPEPEFDFGMETNPTPEEQVPSFTSGSDIGLTSTDITPERPAASTDFDLSSFAVKEKEKAPAAKPEEKDSSFDASVSRVDTSSVRDEDLTESKLGMSEILGLTESTQSDAIQAEPDLEFDVNLTESTVLANEALGGSFFSGLDLDLGGEPQKPAPAAEPVAPAPPIAPPIVSPIAPPIAPPPAVADIADKGSSVGGGEISDSRRDEVNTKLELAQAYEDMGDLEGARELLNEILGEGAPDQVEQAKAILDRLSA
jgi:pilus assembly protein FimV